MSRVQPDAHPTTHIRYWQSFAASGTPGDSWPQWLPSTNATLVWGIQGDNATFTPTSTLKEADCAFWEDRIDDVPLNFVWGDCAANGN
jgi:hypothetical protein